MVHYNLADLHTHSFCSDGLRTPTQAVEEAAGAGVQVLSLTDHDTVEGVPEALQAGEAHGIEVIPGTELSAHLDDREVHLLAYCLDHLSRRLAAYVELVHQQRRDRGAAIVKRLNQLGVDVTLEDVLVRADGGPLGRPHIAAAMVAYTLVDRATWLSFRNTRGLTALVEGDPRLQNDYGVILVDPARHPHVKAALGQAFIDWLLSAEGRIAIASYRIAGRQLFHVD